MLVVCGMLEYCAECLRISPVRELKQSGMGTEEQSRQVRIESVFMTDKGLFKSDSPNEQQLELRGVPLKLRDGFCAQEGKLQGNSGRLCRTLATWKVCGKGTIQSLGCWGTRGNEQMNDLLVFLTR